MPRFYCVLLGCNKVPVKILSVSDTREDLFTLIQSKLSHDFTQQPTSEDSDDNISPELPENYSVTQYKLSEEDWLRLYKDELSVCACGVYDLYIVESTESCDDVSNMIEAFDELRI